MSNSSSIWGPPFFPIRSTYFPLDIFGVLLAFQNVSQTKPGKRYLIFFSLLAYSYCAGGGSCLRDMEVCEGGDNFMPEMEQTDIHEGWQLFVLSSFLKAFFSVYHCVWYSYHHLDRIRMELVVYLLLVLVALYITL